MMAGMAVVLPRFRDLMIAEMQTPGHVNKIYYGHRDIMATKVLRSDTAYIMIEDGGGGDAPNKTGQTRFKRHMIIVEVGVRWTTSDECLQQILDIWKTLEGVMFEPTNQHLIVGDEVTVDLLNLFDVDAGYLLGANNPAWRYRRGVAAYDELYCQRTWE